MSKPVILTRKAALTLGAIVGYLKPKIAQDAKLDMALLSPGLADLTRKNFKSKIPALAAGIKKLTAGKLARDASLDDVEKVLDMLDGHDITEVDTRDALETDPNTGQPIKKPALDDENAELRAYLSSKGMSEEDIATACGMAGPKKAAMDADETDEEKKKREEKEKAEKDKAAKDAENPFATKKDDDKDKKDEGAKDMVTKPAMDAAIATAVKAATESAIKTQRDIKDAERAVRPHVGELAVAFDSAEAVYRTALTTLGEDAKEIATLPLPALRSILKRIPLPGAKRSPAVAMDAAGATSFDTMFPEAKRIQIR